MKVILFCLSFFWSSSFLLAQNITFVLTTSRDTVLMDNVFRVTYTLKSSEKESFEKPDLSSFRVVAGPNKSMSMSYMNGTKSYELSYSYYLQPVEPGEWVVPSLTIETEDGLLATEPKTIVVLPNPKGLKQPADPNPKKNIEPLFNTRPFEPVRAPKKKRKTYRL